MALNDGHDIAALKVVALKAGEDAQLHWYADDRSDDPVDPPAKLRLIIEDASHAAAFVAAGEAKAVDHEIRLGPDWQSPRPSLSYVRVWAILLKKSFFERLLA